MPVKKFFEKFSEITNKTPFPFVYIVKKINRRLLKASEKEQSETADSSQEEQGGDTASVSADSGRDYAVSAISAINLITSMGAESSSASAVSLKTARCLIFFTLR